MFHLLAQRDEGSQGLAEYALILSLIGVVAIAALVFLGSEINDLISEIGTAI
jgi:Flp pilus assembly pilin Flp